MNNKSKALLQAYINVILKEDDSWFDDGGAGGSNLGSNEDMYNIFIKPFANVIGTVAGKTKEISQRSQTVLKVAFETIVTTLIPIYKDSYEEIFKKEKERIDKIKSDYDKYYSASWEILKNADFAIAAFMYRPDLFVTQGFIRKSPEVAAKLINVLSGGTLEGTLTKIMKGSPAKKHNDSEDVMSKYFGESLIREKDNDQQEDPKVLALIKLMSNNKVKQALANSELTQKTSGHEIVDESLKSILKQAQSILKAKSLSDLQKVLGKNIPGIDKLSKVPENERQKAEQVVLGSVKKSMKSFYINQIETQMKKAIEQGVPQEHPYVKVHQSAIKKIKSL